MIYLTSDLHFNHTNILTYCADTRPFSSIEEMNETLINNWNSIVSAEDTVIVVGDMVMGKHTDAYDLLCRLNGKIIVVRGNHDTNPRLEIYKKLGFEVKDIHYFQYKGLWFICCHFPIMSEEWMNMVIGNHAESRNIVLCYGHVHGNTPHGYYEGTYHVGVDTNNLTPVSVENIWSSSLGSEFETPHTHTNFFTKKPLI